MSRISEEPPDTPSCINVNTELLMEDSFKVFLNDSQTFDFLSNLLQTSTNKTSAEITEKWIDLLTRTRRTSNEVEEVESSIHQLSIDSDQSSSSSSSSLSDKEDTLLNTVIPIDLSTSTLIVSENQTEINTGLETAIPLIEKTDSGIDLFCSLDGMKLQEIENKTNLPVLENQIKIDYIKQQKRASTNFDFSNNQSLIPNSLVISQSVDEVTHQNSLTVDLLNLEPHIKKESAIAADLDEKNHLKLVLESFKNRGKRYKDDFAKNAEIKSYVYKIFQSKEQPFVSVSNSSSHSSLITASSGGTDALFTVASSSSSVSVKLSGNENATKSSLDENLDNICPKLNEEEFRNVTNFFEIPVYLSRTFFYKCLKIDKEQNVNISIFSIDREEPKASYVQFLDLWDSILSEATDTHSLAFKILSKRNLKYLIPTDFEMMINELIKLHNGLNYLRGDEMKDFRVRYAETVISRIYFSKSTCHCNEKLSLIEFKNSKVLSILSEFENLVEISDIRNIFSYRHYYVIYCKFWELDKNHDMFIEESDFSQFQYNALTKIVVERILNGAGRPLTNGFISTSQQRTHLYGSRKLSFLDFVNFILANEDKRKPSSIEYWFRILDTDGDGVLSLWELKAFWEEQYYRMIQWNVADPLGIDLIKPKDPCRITVLDLKKCPQNAEMFFDMIFDIQKYEIHMKRVEPNFRDFDNVIVKLADGKSVVLYGWDKYAERAYRLLVQEASDESSTTLQIKKDEVGEQNWVDNTYTGNWNEEIELLN